MKKTILLFFLFLSFNALQSQVLQGDTSVYGRQSKRNRIDSVLQIPIGLTGSNNGLRFSPTMPPIRNGYDTGQVRYNKSDSSVYVNTGSQFIKVGGGSMVYPSEGIAVSTGSAWGASINGSSSQFVKGDGSLDGTAYATQSALVDTALNIRNSINEIDVFLIAGQSNAVGQGNSALSPLVDTGIMYQYYQGQLSNKLGDPIGNAASGSAWPTFAKTYYLATGRKVLFVPMAVNGSALVPAADIGFGNWSQTGVHFQKSVDTTLHAISISKQQGFNPVFKGVLWVQGETDGRGIANSLITANDYINSFDTLMKEFRKGFNQHCPIYVYQIGSYSPYSETSMNLLREAQVTISKNYSDSVKLVFQNAATFSSRGLLSDGVHYTQNGLNEMGRLSAENIVGQQFLQWQKRGVTDIYYSTGNVAIGQKNASAGLDVFKTSGLAAVFRSDAADASTIHINNLNTGSNAAAGIRFNNSAGLQAQLLLGSSSYSLGNNHVVFHTIGSGSMRIGSNSGDVDLFTGLPFISSAKLRIKPNGNVGIGDNINATEKLEVSGKTKTTTLQVTGISSSANTADSMMVVNAANGNVGYRAIPSGGGITGSGTTGSLTKWASSTSLTDAVAGTDYAAASHTHTASQISDATTIGRNILTSTNPSAVRFGRANADNTFDWLTASDFRTAIGAGTGSGNVTKVGTPANNEIGVWTGDGTLGRDANFRWNGNLLLGNQTTTVTSTPLYISSGGTAGNNTPGTSGNLKWKLFDNGTASDDYGIGMSAFLMEFRGGASAALGFYVNNGVEALKLNSSGTATFSYAVTVPNDAYNPTSWNGNNEVPTKDAIRDKIESMGGGGTVSSFTFTDGNGFDGTVTNSTTTPALSLTTTATNKSLLFSNSGAIGSSIATQETDYIKIANTNSSVTPFVVDGFEGLTDPIAKFQILAGDLVTINSDGSISFAENSSAVSTPAAGFGKIFVKNDNKLYFKNDGGTEYDLTAAGGGLTYAQSKSLTYKFR